MAIFDLFDLDRNGLLEICARLRHRLYRTILLALFCAYLANLLTNVLKTVRQLLGILLEEICRTFPIFLQLLRAFLHILLALV